VAQVVGRLPYQVWCPEFKPQYHPPKNTYRAEKDCRGGISLVFSAKSIGITSNKCTLYFTLSVSWVKLWSVHPFKETLPVTHVHLHVAMARVMVTHKVLKSALSCLCTCVMCAVQMYFNIYPLYYSSANSEQSISLWIYVFFSKMSVRAGDGAQW
jgi:hypothetical protein